METNHDFILISIIGIVSIVNNLFLLYLISKLSSMAVELGLEKLEDSSEHSETQYNVGVLTKIDDYKDVLISNKTESRIFKEFEKAEENHFYLQKNISLTDLANKLNTNKRYVSYILKKYRKQDFNSYLQFARINYLLMIVEREPEFLTEKLSILANLCGFTSHSKFSSVFRLVTGLSPTDYFQRYKLNKF